jgi:hypothetical protein
MSRIEQIIDDIETFINGCKMVPLSSSKIAVNKEEMKEYLADLREEIPVEIKQYQRVLSNQEAIIADAKLQASSIVANANRMTEELTNEHEIMQKAYARAEEMIQEAQLRAEDIVNNATAEANNVKTAAIQYTDELLSNVQSMLQSSLGGAQSKFDQFTSDLRLTIHTIDQNRNDLARSYNEVVPPEQNEQNDELESYDDGQQMGYYSNQE